VAEVLTGVPELGREQRRQKKRERKRKGQGAKQKLYFKRQQPGIFSKGGKTADLKVPCRFKKYHEPEAR
jgi:hypothetical protein